MRIPKCVSLLPLLGAVALAAAGEEAPQQSIQIADNERVVHVVGSQFTHSYYEPRLETALLERYACRGLLFRQVAQDGSMVALLRDLDARVMIHKPTLVIIQAGNDDLIASTAARPLTFPSIRNRPTPSSKGFATRASESSSVPWSRSRTAALGRS